MGQCSSSSSSSSNGGVVAPEPALVPMAVRVKICNERKKRNIGMALATWVCNGEGARMWHRNEDGLEISMRGNFVPSTLDKCLQKHARYVEIQHLDHVEAAT